MFAKYSAKIIVVFVLVTSFLQASDLESLYYYQNEQVYLSVLGDQLLIETNMQMDKNNLEKLLRKNLPANYANIEKSIHSKKHIVHLKNRITKQQVASIITKLKSDAQIRFANPVFRYKDSKVRQFIAQNFMVRFIDSYSNKDITNFLSENNLQQIKKIAPQTFLLEVSVSTGLNGLTAANKFYSHPALVWAQPNFYYFDDAILNSTVDDPYWPQQWSHVNSGQSVVSAAGDEYPATVNGYVDADMDVDEAWDVLINNGGSAGGSSSILVAILDSGVDIDHPDLQNNISASGVDLTNDGTLDDTHGHGTQCAGLVVAEGDNGIGVAGVAYNTQLMPVKWYSWTSGGSDDVIVQAIDYAWQNGADILSNSWGGTTPDAAIDEAISRARTQGRGGLGCVIFFSSGNEGRGTVNYPAYLSDVIAVGASNMFDEKKHTGSSEMNYKWAANFGDDLDIVAPTTCYTTDILGTAGFSEDDYFDHFGGTSAACPNAAAVSALVLSANSGLTSDQVQQILQSSADKIETYPYDSDGWNNHVGYGRVNAKNAVQAALSQDGEPPLIIHTQLQPTRSIQSRTVSADITDNSSVASDAAQPLCYYRTVFESTTSDWQSVTDADGPSGDTYEFIIPGQKWNTEVQYYIAAQDAASEPNVQTFPSGGSGNAPPGSSAPNRYLNYLVGNFTSQTYSATDVPVSWNNQYKSHSSTLNISADRTIVDLDVAMTVSGKEFTVTLESPETKGSGLAGIYGEKSQTFTFSGTNLDDEATTTLSDGSSPYSGTYLADNALNVFDGSSTNGDWILRAYQDPETSYPGGEGTITSWSLNVTYGLENAAPQVSDIPAQVIDEGGTFSTISLDNYVSDSDHPDDSLSWSYSGNSELTVSINSSRVLSVSTPNENWFGNEIITLTAMDPGGYTSSDTVNFVVNAVNDAPVVSTIDDQTIDEGETFLQITLDDFVSDIDNEDSEISWEYSGNTELTIEISGQRVATVTIPDTNWFGSESIQFTATDPGNLSDNTTVIFTANSVNDAPVITSVAITEGREALLYEYQLSASDIEDDALVYHLLQAPSFLSIDTSSGLISGTPLQEDVGSYTIIANVTDIYQASDKQEYELEIAAYNDAPLVTDIPDQTIDEGENFSNISLDNYVSDPDNSDEEIDWSWQGNNYLTLQMDANRILTISAPDTNWNGTETILFVAQDPDGLKDSSEVIFKINSINDRPAIISQPITKGVQDVLYEYQLVVSDPDSNESISYELVTAPDFLEINASGLVYGTPHEGDIGSHAVEVKVTDKDLAFDTQEYQLQISNTNDAPVVSQIPDQTVDEGAAFSVITLDDYVEDVDDADSLLSWTHIGSTDLEIEINNYHKATIIIPDSNWNGQESITFIVSDPAGLSDSTTVVFTVNAINDNPQITSEPVTFATQNILYEYQVVASDVDEGDVLLYQLLQAPDFLEMNDTGLIFGTPSNSDVGNHTIEIEVSDNNDGSTTQKFTLLVDDVNEVPQISPPLPVITFAEDDSLFYAFSNWYPFVSDPEQQDADLEYLVTNPSGNVEAAILENGYSFFAAQDWFGADTLMLKISDGQLADSAQFNVTVLARNDAPQIVNLPDSIQFKQDEIDTLFLKAFRYDVDTADSLLTWNFSVSDTALKMDFVIDEELLKLSSENFYGYVDLFFKLYDDSLAECLDTIKVHILKGETAIEDRLAEIPQNSILYQNYPNPFNPQTTICYYLSKKSAVEISVYNVLGEKVVTLVKKEQASGEYQVSFNAQSLTSGVYFYRLNTSDGVLVRKMLLMK